MKIYFSQPDHNYDTEDMFTDEKGGLYYFELEYGTNAGGTDEFMLRDTCGREVPVCVEEIPNMIKALLEIYSLSSEINILRSTEQLVNSDFTAQVKNGKTHFTNQSIRNVIG